MLLGCQPAFFDLAGLTAGHFLCLRSHVGRIGTASRRRNAHACLARLQHVMHTFRTIAMTRNFARFTRSCFLFLFWSFKSLNVRSRLLIFIIVAMCVRTCVHRSTRSMLADESVRTSCSRVGVADRLPRVERRSCRVARVSELQFGSIKAAAPLHLADLPHNRQLQPVQPTPLFLLSVPCIAPLV